MPDKPMPPPTEAGPALDAWLAEWLTGYRWILAKECDWFTTGWGRDSCAANRMRQGLAWMAKGKDLENPLYEIVDQPDKTVLNTPYRSLPGEAARWGYPPAYSTSTALALDEVGEAMEAAEWQWLLCADATGNYHCQVS